MSDAAMARAFCLLIACGLNAASAQPPERGCVMLVPSGVTRVSAEDVINRDLCIPDGKAVSYLAVWETRSWTGKVVPPYNRVMMTPRPGYGPATVTVQTPNGIYRVEISALQPRPAFRSYICPCWVPYRSPEPQYIP